MSNANEKYFAVMQLFLLWYAISGIDKQCKLLRIAVHNVCRVTWDFKHRLHVSDTNANAGVVYTKRKFKQKQIKLIFI